MKIFKDFEGNEIRLTDERLEHILLHPEMADMIENIEVALRNPDYVVQSFADLDVRLHLKHFITKFFGDKYLCVVVKYIENDSFIITFYLIRELPKGEIIWQKN